MALKKLDNLVKFLKKNPLIVVGLIVVAYFVFNNYSNTFNKLSGMTQQQNVDDDSKVVVDSVRGAEPLAQSNLASASGLSTNNYGMPPGCAKQDVVDPKELLPRDSNSEFAKLNPAGAGDLKNVNLLKAGHHVGINTVGQSLRNANLQLRSDPPIQSTNVGPWNNTTISGDPNRRQLELA